MLLNIDLLQPNLVLYQKVHFVQWAAAEGCALQQKEHHSSLLFIMFLYSYFLSVFIHCHTAASIGLKTVLKSVHSDWERPIPPKLWEQAVPLCENWYSTLSQGKILYLFVHLIIWMSPAIMTIFLTWSSHMILPPACLYILLSWNKCILLSNAHFKLSMKKQAKIWLGEHMCSFFSLLLRQIDSALWGLSSETVTCAAVTRSLSEQRNAL